MSDDRWQRDDNANANDERAPYIDRKPLPQRTRRPFWKDGNRYVTAEEIEEFLRREYGVGLPERKT